jgi:hypothetical protein
VNRFGELLRYYRSQCWDAERGRVLTQERLGELLGRALGDAGYTGQAVSEWERGKSRIRHDQRRVLVQLIKVLHECGGLKTLMEANTLLLAGDYRSLDTEEQRQVAPEWSAEGAAEHTPQGVGGQGQMIAMLLTELFFRPVEALREARPRVGDGQRPDWTETLLAMMGRPTRRWSSAQTLRAMAWAGVWCLAWGSTFPLLHWPYASQESAWLAVLAYAGGALLVPALIAGLTRTRGDVFWEGQHLARTFTLRLFTHQGAHAGFHVGYMMVFAIALAGHYLGLGAAPRWLEGLAAAWPVVLGYAAARQVPFNLWRAFGGLRFTRTDLAPSLAFVLFGPLGASFFFVYHPWLLFPPLGLPLILCALILSAALATRQSRGGKGKNTPATR